MQIACNELLMRGIQSTLSSLVLQRKGVMEIKSLQQRNQVSLSLLQLQGLWWMRGIKRLQPKILGRRK
jgi:hypothetical protein